MVGASKPHGIAAGFLGPAPRDTLGTDSGPANDLVE